MVLHEGDQHLVCKAEDAGKDALDRDYQSVTIKAMPVLLSRAQCAAWGRPMHWKGRVVYVIQPEGADEKPQQRRKRKASSSMED
jgi:hypothetical protein